jgi:hypothetical protein
MNPRESGWTSRASAGFQFLKAGGGSRNDVSRTAPAGASTAPSSQKSARMGHPPGNVRFVSRFPWWKAPL